LNKILVLFTGGTIGSRKTGRSINVDQAASYELIKLYEESPHKIDVPFEARQPLNVLSENMVPEEWLILINVLNTIDFTQYQGVILTHGTDTLPFTAAALSFVFKHIPIPLVLIASNFPLDDSRGKGVQNFSHAVDFIVGHALSGVFVIFENSQGEAVVHLGTRLMPSDPYTDEFDSTYSITFGTMVNRGLIHHTHALNPTLRMIQAERVNVLNQGQVSFSSEVLYIKPYPGLDYRFYDFTQHKPKAILHDLYHSGTACTRSIASIRSSLLDFISYCKLYDVEIYIAPLKNKSGDLYASSVQLIKAGAIPIENISVEAALVKLMLAYGTFHERAEIMEFIHGPSLFFEVHREN
jgi:L-asparaginase